MPSWFQWVVGILLAIAFIVWLNYITDNRDMF
jgi:predicted outer membrane lipoprotein